jgi:hypothetical protein
LEHHEFHHTGFGHRRGGVGKYHEHEFKKRLLLLPGFWRVDDRAKRSGEYYQYFVGLVDSSALQGVHVFDREIRPQQLDAVSGAGMEY